MPDWPFFGYPLFNAFGKLDKSNRVTRKQTIGYQRNDGKNNISFLICYSIEYKKILLHIVFVTFSFVGTLASQ